MNTQDKETDISNLPVVLSEDWYLSAARLLQGKNRISIAMGLANRFLLDSFGDHLYSGIPRSTNIANDESVETPIIYHKPSGVEVEIGCLYIDVNTMRIVDFPKKEELLRRIESA